MRVLYGLAAWEVQFVFGFRALAEEAFPESIPILYGLCVLSFQ